MRLQCSWVGGSDSAICVLAIAVALTHTPLILRPHTVTHTHYPQPSHLHTLPPAHSLTHTTLLHTPSHPYIPTHTPSHTSYPHTLTLHTSTHALTGEDYSEWFHHPWLPGGVDTSCQVSGYGVGSGGGAQSRQGGPTSARCLLLWKSLHQVMSCEWF